MLNKEQISEWLMGLQDSICKSLELADGTSKFIEDNWQRPEGGGGRSRVIEGEVIEKGGVNYSAVFGEAPSFLVKESDKVDGKNPTFYATGVSIVMHPKNPHVPIIHMNVRYFEMSNGVKWFGGGIDLTPHYVIEGDANYFHQQLKMACDKHNQNYYPDFKKWADDYFYIKHRNETRGIGGIFFDHLKPANEKEKSELFEFLKSIGNSFAPIYVHFINKYKNTPFTEQHKQWQLLRRGRYVEFNLVYDRGTKFGLETNGRTESILMSLPPQANWNYNHKTKPGTEEEKTLSFLKKGINWV